MGEQLSLKNRRLIDAALGCGKLFKDREMHLNSEEIEILLNAARSEGPHPESGGLKQSELTDLGDAISAYKVRCAEMDAASPPPLEGAGRGEDGSSQSQPVLSPKSDNADGWIRWNGGACPVATGTPIDVRYRDGQELLCLPADRLADSSRDASEAFWRNDDCENDIVAYRLALADGALGRQDEVIQPIRDEPISSSKVNIHRTQQSEDHQGSDPVE